MIKSMIYIKIIRNNYFKKRRARRTFEMTTINIYMIRILFKKYIILLQRTTYMLTTFINHVVLMLHNIRYI